MLKIQNKLENTNSNIQRAYIIRESSLEKHPQLWNLLHMLVQLPVNGVEFSSLLQRINSEIQDSSTLLDLLFSAEAHFPLKLAQLESFLVSFKGKFQHNKEYQAALLDFYARYAKNHKIIEHLHKQSNLNSDELEKLIAASFELTQYQIVIELYLKYKNTKTPISEDALFHIGRSYQNLEKYSDACLVFDVLAKVKNLKPLPDLKTTVEKFFNSETDKKKFYHEMQNAVSDNKKRMKYELNSWIDYSMCLIHEDRYEEALQALLAIKQDRFAAKNQ